MSGLLTRRQSQILDYVRGYVEGHGYAPSLQNIADAFGLRSLATVHAHLSRLQNKGLIVRGHNLSRAVRVVDSCPYCGK